MNPLQKSISIAVLAAAASLAHADAGHYPGENSMSRFTGESVAVPSYVPAAPAARTRVDLTTAPYGDNSIDRATGESAAQFDAAEHASRAEPRHPHVADPNARRPVPFENLSHSHRERDPFPSNTGA